MFEAPVDPVLNVLNALVVLKNEIIHWFWIMSVIVRLWDIAYDAERTKC